MSVFRIHKTENYTIMSNSHFKEKGMSLKAKGLLSLMLSLPDSWNYSVSGLVTLSKDGKDSVMSALSELEDFGYLKRTRQTNDKGQFAGIQYDIFEQPQPKEPIAANPISEKQKQDFPTSEEPSQLITNSIKNLEDKLFTELSTKEKDIELIALYRDYIRMRDEIEAPLTETGLEKLIARAKRLSKDNLKIEKVLLETAIINNWKNIYPPRESELARLSEDMRTEMRHMFHLDQFHVKQYLELAAQLKLFKNFFYNIITKYQKIVDYIIHFCPFAIERK